MAATKQTIAVLLGYLTCDDPVMKTKYENILASFWHKDEGLVVQSVDNDGNGGTDMLFSDGNVVNFPALPTSKPISFITDLLDALNAKVDVIVGKQLSTEDFTTAFKSKLAGLTNYVHPAQHLISEVQDLQTTLDAKVDKIPGKGLSTNDLTDALLVLINAAPTLSIQDANAIEQFNLSLPDILQFDGFSFDVPNKRIISKSSTFINTYYVDNSLPDSNNAVVNDKTKPFANLTDVFASLPTFNGSYIRIFFLTSGVHLGCELTNINIIWDALTDATIDFTGINAQIRANSNHLSRVIVPNGTLITDTNFHFVDGKISIISTTNDKEQLFAIWFNFGSIKYTGELGSFDWQAQSGLNAHDTIFRSGTKTTGFRIDNLYFYDSNINNPIGFKLGSEINISKLNLAITISNFGFNSIENGFNVVVDDFNITGGGKCSLGTSKWTFKNITGNGKIQNGTGTVVFDNCTIEAGITFPIAAGTFIGRTICTHSLLIAGWFASLVTFRNLTTTVENLTSHGANAQLILQGTNKLTVATKLLTISAMHDDAIVIEDGITIIESKTPATQLITGTTTQSIKNKGILMTNVTTVGMPNINENSIL